MERDDWSDERLLQCLLLTFLGACLCSLLLSSKTYTLQGMSDEKGVARSAAADVADARGLMPRVFDYLMTAMANEERRSDMPGATSKIVYTCRLSSLEIYKSVRTDEKSGASRQHRITTGKLTVALCLPLLFCPCL